MGVLVKTLRYFCQIFGIWEKGKLIEKIKFKFKFFNGDCDVIVESHVVKK